MPKERKNNPKKLRKEKCSSDDIPQGMLVQTRYGKTWWWTRGNAPKVKFKKPTHGRFETPTSLSEQRQKVKALYGPFPRSKSAYPSYDGWEGTEQEWNEWKNSGAAVPFDYDTIEYFGPTVFYGIPGCFKEPIIPFISGAFPTPTRPISFSHVLSGLAYGSLSRGNKYMKKLFPHERRYKGWNNETGKQYFLGYLENHTPLETFLRENPALLKQNANDIFKLLAFDNPFNSLKRPYQVGSRAYAEFVIPDVFYEFSHWDVYLPRYTDEISIAAYNVLELEQRLYDQEHELIGMKEVFDEMKADKTNMIPSWVVFEKGSISLSKEVPLSKKDEAWKEYSAFKKEIDELKSKYRAVKFDERLYRSKIEDERNRLVAFDNHIRWAKDILSHKNRYESSSTGVKKIKRAESILKHLTPQMRKALEEEIKSNIDAYESYIKEMKQKEKENSAYLNKLEKKIREKEKLSFEKWKEYRQLMSPYDSHMNNKKRLYELSREKEELLVKMSKKDNQMMWMSNEIVKINNLLNTVTYGEESVSSLTKRKRYFEDLISKYSKDNERMRERILDIEAEQAVVKKEVDLVESTLNRVRHLFMDEMTLQGLQKKTYGGRYIKTMEELNGNRQRPWGSLPESTSSVVDSNNPLRIPISKGRRIPAKHTILYRPEVHYEYYMNIIEEGVTPRARKYVLNLKKEMNHLMETKILPLVDKLQKAGINLYLNKKEYAISVTDSDYEKILKDTALFELYEKLIEAYKELDVMKTDYNAYFSSMFRTHQNPASMVTGQSGRLPAKYEYELGDKERVVSYTMRPILYECYYQCVSQKLKTEYNIDSGKFMDSVYFPWVHKKMRSVKVIKPSPETKRKFKSDLANIKNTGMVEYVGNTVDFGGEKLYPELNSIFDIASLSGQSPYAVAMWARTEGVKHAMRRALLAIRYIFAREQPFNNPDPTGEYKDDQIWAAYKFRILNEGLFEGIFGFDENGYTTIYDRSVHVIVNFRDDYKDIDVPYARSVVYDDAAGKYPLLRISIGIHENYVYEPTYIFKKRIKYKGPKPIPYEKTKVERQKYVLSVKHGPQPEVEGQRVKRYPIRVIIDLPSPKGIKRDVFYDAKDIVSRLYRNALYEYFKGNKDYAFIGVVIPDIHEKSAYYKQFAEPIRKEYNISSTFKKAFLKLGKYAMTPAGQAELKQHQHYQAIKIFEEVQFSEFDKYSPPVKIHTGEEYGEPSIISKTVEEEALKPHFGEPEGKGRLIEATVKEKDVWATKEPIEVFLVAAIKAVEDVLIDRFLRRMKEQYVQMIEFYNDAMNVAVIGDSPMFDYFPRKDKYGRYIDYDEESIAKQTLYDSYLFVHEYERNKNKEQATLDAIEDYLDRRTEETPEVPEKDEEMEVENEQSNRG